MRELRDTVNEAMKRDRRPVKLRKREYKHFPKDKDELKSIIEDRIENEGADCNLNDIDVSKITDMSYLFYESTFNGDISDWDVSNVKDMGGMFYGCSFKGDISDWDVSSVWNMESMFCDSKFNGDISEWDVSSVEYMDNMFSFSDFKDDISDWDVSNVKNMMYIFYKCPLEANPPKWYKE